MSLKKTLTLFTTNSILSSICSSRIRNAFGYILRITDLKHNEIFNIFLDGSKDDIIELNREGYKELITYKFNPQELKDKHWFPFQLAFQSGQENHHHESQWTCIKHL
jgi:hypothetical protein